MLAEWSAECSAEDPVLVVPWKDPDGKAAFVDLRANPYDFDAIPEAEQYPPLMQALRALNATRSPVFTAKCDAWPLADEELEHLQLNLDADPADAAPQPVIRFCQLHRPGRARARPLHFVSQARADAAPADPPRCSARPSCRGARLRAASRVARPGDSQQGFAFSLYVKALGADPQAALGGVVPPDSSNATVPRLAL